MGGCSGIFNWLRDLNLSVLGGADFQEFGDILVVGASQVVGGTTVVRDVKSDFFLQRIDTEHSESVERVEERSHDGENPSADPDDSNDLDSKELAASTKEQTVTIGGVSGSFLKFLGGEKTDGDNSPSSVGEVNRNGIDGIINLHGDEELGESVVDKSCNNSNDAGGPWVDNGASSSDTDKSTKSSIHGHGQIIRDLSSLLVFHETVDRHGSHTSTGSGKGGGDSAKGSSGSRSFVGNGQGGSRVESIPSEPEDESSEDLEGGGVGREISRSLEGIAIIVVESSSARSKDDSSNKSAVKKIQ